MAALVESCLRGTWLIVMMTRSLAWDIDLEPNGKELYRKHNHLLRLVQCLQYSSYIRMNMSFMITIQLPKDHQCITQCIEIDQLLQEPASQSQLSEPRQTLASTKISSLPSKNNHTKNWRESALPQTINFRPYTNLFAIFHSSLTFSHPPFREERE